MPAKHETWMPLYIADYLGDTMHLTAEQHGAYLLLLMAAWKRGGHVPDDDDQLAAISRTGERWQTHCGRIVRAFFTQRDGLLFHGRVEAELIAAREKVSKRAEAGRAGAAAKWQRDGKRIGDAMPEQRQIDAPSPSPSPISTPDGVDKARKPKFDAAAIDLPDWLDREAWATWCNDRKARKKPITETAATLQIRQLGEYLQAGHLPERVIAHSIAGGFQGLYPPKTTTVHGGHAPESFAERSERHAKQRVAELIGGTAPSMHDTGDVIDVDPAMPRIAP